MYVFGLYYNNKISRSSRAERMDKKDCSWLFSGIHDGNKFRRYLYTCITDGADRRTHLPAPACRAQSVTEDQ